MANYHRIGDHRVVIHMSGLVDIYANEDRPLGGGACVQFGPDEARQLTSLLTRELPREEGPKRLVRWSANYGRMGSLSGVIVLDEEDWRIWKAYEKHEVQGCAYDVLGKHSQIPLTISPDAYTVLDVSQAFIEQAQAVFGKVQGFNPMDYIETDLIPDDLYKEIYGDQCPSKGDRWRDMPKEES